MDKTVSKIKAFSSLEEAIPHLSLKWQAPCKDLLNALERVNKQTPYYIRFYNDRDDEEPTLIEATLRIGQNIKISLFKNGEVEMFLIASAVNYSDPEKPLLEDCIAKKLNRHFKHEDYWIKEIVRLSPPRSKGNSPALPARKEEPKIAPLSTAYIPPLNKDFSEIFNYGRVSTTEKISLDKKPVTDKKPIQQSIICTIGELLQGAFVADVNGSFAGYIVRDSYYNHLEDQTKVTVQKTNGDCVSVPINTRVYYLRNLNDRIDSHGTFDSVLAIGGQKSIVKQIIGKVSNLPIGSVFVLASERNGNGDSYTIKAKTNKFAHCDFVGDPTLIREKRGAFLKDTVVQTISLPRVNLGYAKPGDVFLYAQSIVVVLEITTGLAKLFTLTKTPTPCIQWVSLTPESIGVLYID
jgi:hypothetical protein